MKDVIQLTLALISTGITENTMAMETNENKQYLSKSSITVLVEGERGTGARENRGGRLRGAWEKRGREVEFLRRRQPGKIMEHFAILLYILQLK